MPLLSAAGEVVDAVSVVEDAMRLYSEGRLESLRELVHPDAEIQMLFLGGELARGPDGLISALRQAASSIHVPTGTRVERIDEQAAVLVGRILHQIQSEVFPIMAPPG